jgi:hypothetical protein
MRLREIERLYRAIDVDGRGYLDRGEWEGGQRGTTGMQIGLTDSRVRCLLLPGSVHALMTVLRQGHEMPAVAEEEVS